MRESLWHLRRRSVTVPISDGVFLDIVSMLVSLPIHTYWKASVANLKPGLIGYNKPDAKIIYSKRPVNTVLNVVHMSILRLKSRRTAGSSYSTLTPQKSGPYPKRKWYVTHFLKGL